MALVVGTATLQKFEESLTKKEASTKTNYIMFGDAVVTLDD